MGAASIRTEPASGTCLSTLVDKALDAGYLTIGTDLVVRVDGAKLVNDPALLARLPSTTASRWRHL